MRLVIVRGWLMYNIRVPGEQQLNEGLGEVKRGEGCALVPSHCALLYRESALFISISLDRLVLNTVERGAHTD